LAQSFGSLLQLKVAQILEHDRRHGHAQRGGEILHRHRLLLLRVGQEIDQPLRQILRTAGFIKLNGKLFAVSHLTEVRQVGAHDRNPIGACQVRHSAASCR
jgi:hypothetical protein